jgi:hypothetical protein
LAKGEIVMAQMPKRPRDLSLPPVATQIDRNLHALRDSSDPAEVGRLLEVALEQHAFDEAARAAQVVAIATSGVNMHGWNARLTDDHSRVALSGGSTLLELGLSPAITRYVEAGQAG